MQATEKIWMNGELVDWDDARIHVGAHGLHYGSGVFEGVRCYDTPKGPAVFRLTDHMQRLHDSARLINMEIPYTVEDLRNATNELLGANGLAGTHGGAPSRGAPATERRGARGSRRPSLE